MSMKVIDEAWSTTCLIDPLPKTFCHRHWCTDGDDNNKNQFNGTFKVCRNFADIIFFNQQALLQLTVWTFIGSKFPTYEVCENVRQLSKNKPAN